MDGRQGAEESYCRSRKNRQRSIVIMKVFVAALLIALSADVFAQQKIPTDSIAKKMEWFADAKLGIFIHYGIYAVNGIDESWSFYNKKIAYWDYMKQLK